jgi:hypothetical protein
MRTHFADFLPLIEYFYNLVDWLERANAVLPNHVMTGFTVSFAICCLLFLPILLIVLRMVWAIAEVGPARKSMTSFFIVSLGVPLYPVLTALLLALLWLAIGCAMLILSSFGPAALLFWLMVRLWEFKTDFVEAELDKSGDMQRGNEPVEDITCWELVCGLFIGILSCCSFGMSLSCQNKLYILIGANEKRNVFLFFCDFFIGHFFLITPTAARNCPHVLKFPCTLGYMPCMWLPHLHRKTIFGPQVGVCADHPEVAPGDSLVCPAVYLRVSLPLAGSRALRLPSVLLNLCPTSHGSD